MIENYLITTSVIATALLIWRNILLDNNNILEKVEKIPVLGKALSCGFCSALWFSLIGVFIYNPIDFWTKNLLVPWFCVGLGVLFLRNLIAILMEGVGVLTHLHRNNHK